MKKSSIDSQEEARARLKEKWKISGGNKVSLCPKILKIMMKNRVGQSLLRWSAD